MKTNESVILSIITVCRNAKAGLLKTMASIDAQSCLTVEHLIIDGASTDGTIELFNQDQASYRLFQSEPDTGIYNAMNKGLAKASGYWVLFLNAGDVLAENNTLNRLLEDLGRLSNCDWVGGQVKIEGSSNSLETIYFRNGKPQFHPHPGTVYKCSFLKKFGGFDEGLRVSADYAFAFEHFPNSIYQIIDLPLTIMESGGLSQAASLQRFKEDIWIRIRLGKISTFERLRMVLGHTLGMFREFFQDKN